ncbi:hypothetical protein CPB83DRAFT_817970 [Crepidotus variabilis]|uniref:Uncharacterized protein n=1 Tax=Crepidotus variabilis TaxID=179855 RepID=A0A9P6EBC2_9AGAR|nr:hypothetical protein CPB83DRAFT_817970 [Crepidotus variabilis]
MSEITTITAPLLLGPLLSTFFFGILTVQLYFYSISFASDAVYIKSLVWGVYALETAATIMTISDTYQWLAKGFGNVKGLDNVFLSPIYTPIMGPIIAGTVQMFYGYRIFKIERKAWPVSVFISLVPLIPTLPPCLSDGIAVCA